MAAAQVEVRDLSPNSISFMSHTAFGEGRERLEGFVARSAIEVVAAIILLH